LDTIILAPDGKTLYVISSENTKGGREGVIILNARTGQERLLPTKEGESVWTMALSPDGRALATSTRGKAAVVRLMEVSTGQEIFAGEGHKGFIGGPAWSPNGRLLSSGDSSESIRLWNATNGQELACFNNLKSRSVLALAFAPDGTTLVAGFSDGTMLVFDVAKYDPRPKSVPKLSEAELKSLWSDLTAHAGQAHRAGWALSDSARETAPFIRGRLKPIPVADAAMMRKSIGDLGNGAFAVRDAATKQLKALGEQAEPSMRAALKGDVPLETRRRLSQFLDDTPGPDLLRSIRAVAVLERIGSVEAVGVLEALAKGAPGVRTTEEAAALVRIRGNNR